MWNPHFSIRTTLLAIIGILNLFVAVLVGSNLYESWGSHQQIKQLRNNATVSNILYETEKYLSRERAIAMSALNVSPESVETLFQDLDESRALADGMLNRGLDFLEAETAYDIPAAIGRARQKHRMLQQVRAEFDKTRSGTAGESRRRELLEQYFDTITDLAMEIGSLIETYTLITAGINATAIQQVRLKQVIWQITEFAGREYAVIGSMVATGAVSTPKIQAELHLWRGHVEYGWQIARHLIQGSDLTQQLGPYIAEAESHYFLTFEQIKDIFYDPEVISMEAPYPIGVELWLEMASQAVESLRAMQDAVLEENLTYIQRLEGEAQEKTIISLSLLVVALGLSFYSAFVVIFRVVRPVNTMIGALYKAIQGESYEVPVGHAYSDEIGKLARVLEAFRDQAKELDERRIYLKTVLATMLDAIVTIDAEGEIQMVNPSAERIFEYDERELIGKNVTVLMPASYIDAHRQGMARYLTTGEAKIMGAITELEGRRKGGEVFPMEIAITEMRRGEDRLFVGVLRDITQRKAAEEKIRASMAELEKSNIELDDFAYIASHDLKEPLRGIHNFSGFLLEDYEEKLDEEGKDMLRTIATLTQQMEGLINALLHYSRLGRTELSIQETDLNELVQSVLNIYAITIDQKNAKIITQDLPRIVCDHVRIKEVFQNLVGNALKYSDQENPVIEIGVTNEHPDMFGTPVFYVRDNGLGIERRHLESVFKIFRRLHPRNAYGGGTGSGLTIAKKIIVQHGGEIWAESEGLGRGTTFYFTIPSQTARRKR